MMIPLASLGMTVLLPHVAVLGGRASSLFEYFAAAILCARTYERQCGQRSNLQGNDARTSEARAGALTSFSLKLEKSICCDFGMKAQKMTFDNC